ncbi:MAG: hypothetical protein H6Q33_3403, partial [Deltaproteobacteria bacterium]|nr:hypothetical protein [Deltaproteobacteria bacterium]
MGRKESARGIEIVAVALFLCVS